MQGTCPNSGCNAAYTLTPQHVGRQFACRDCGAMLRVEADGVLVPVTQATVRPASPAMSSLPAATLIQPQPTAPTAPAISPALSSKKVRDALDLQSIVGIARQSVFDWGFAIGAAMVIIFTFFPVLDRLHLARYEADIQATQTEYKRSDRDSTSKLTDDIRKNREKRIQSLEDYAEDARASLKYSGWWYAWGTLLGFLLLGVGCIGWMSPGQSKTHQVVGAIVMCAELLLIFITYVFGSMRG